MAKTMTTTAQSALARMTADIDDDAKAHLLRAASFKFERRLHDIQAAAFEAQKTARAEYLEEVAAINEGAGSESPLAFTLPSDSASRWTRPNYART